MALDSGVNSDANIFSNPISQLKHKVKFTYFSKGKLLREVHYFQERDKDLKSNKLTEISLDNVDPSI